MIYSLLAVLALTYLSLCAFLYFNQERSIFFPGPNDPQLVNAFQTQRIEIPATGATLEGWWLDNPHATTPFLILYFGGNGEDVLYTASDFEQLKARHLLVVNYRSYGNSTGKPGQEALYDDALAIYDYAMRRGVPPKNIVVMGRSLGSGIAAMVAGRREVRAAILITPFDSLAAVAAAHYPYFPVRWLLRHPFPSTDWARHAQAPALILAAERDDIVPSQHAQRLFDAWHGQKQIHILKGRGHNDIQTDPSYYRLINEFLSAQ